MKKILVVFTGGTIGSSVTDETINTSSKAAFALLQLFQQHDIEPAGIHFDTLQP
jgi:L-asparaginase